jgi:hypothetical protein
MPIMLCVDSICTVQTPSTVNQEGHVLHMLWSYLLSVSLTYKGMETVNLAQPTAMGKFLPWGMHCAEVAFTGATKSLGCICSSGVNF